MKSAERSRKSIIHKLFALHASCIFLVALASCSSKELIVPKYTSAQSTTFVIGILALGVLIQVKSDKEIASVLDISPSTVANHNRKLYRKLDVSSRTGVISKYSRISEQ